MRSGIRSWSKCVIFSRRMKSSSKAGPRKPAFSEFWLSATDTPWFVVRTRPPESTRTRSSGRLPGLNPARADVPAFSDSLLSVSVLPVAAGSDGALATPSGGTRARSPCSASLLALNGMCAASACVAAILATCASPAARRPAKSACDGPLTVERALVFEAAPPPSRILLVLAASFLEVSARDVLRLVLPGFFVAMA